MESSSPGQLSQSAAGVSATPPHDQCNMKLMRKHVVNRLSPYCTVVCQHLGYTPARLEGDDKRNLIAVLEKWITTGRPKTWSVFIGVLNNISELSVVTNEICSDLNKAGVHVVPPTSRSHDPSLRQNYPQFRPTMVQDDTSSLTCTIDGGTNQSAVGMTATPTNSQCSIKIMRRCVVDKLAPYWIMVCHHLGYSDAAFRQDSPKKSLVAVLEHWITTGEKERRPKTWSMFIEVLSDVNELSSVTSVICSELNKAGVCTAPSTLASHEPSLTQNYPQSQPTMIQDNTSSLTCVADAPNKPSAGQSPPAPSGERQLDMKTMYKHVVSKLSPYWTTVGDYLEYSVVERNSFRGANNNKSLATLLENWISTDNGRKPKTWATFLDVLEELDQDLSISVGSEICANLESEVFPSGAHSKAPVRSASYSTPSAHQGEHKQMRSTRALSYPKAKNPPTDAYHKHPQSDVKRQLVYGDVSNASITEESPEKSLQVSRHGQPYAATNQFPHGQKFASIQPSFSYPPCTTATHQPPHGHTSLYGPAVRSPSPTNTTSHQAPHGQRYPGTSPAPPNTATHPPPGHHPHPPPVSHSSFYQRWYHPSQRNRPGPPQGYSSMSSSQRYIYPSSQGYQSMNISQGPPSMNPLQGYSIVNPSQGPPSMNPSQSPPSMNPSQGPPSMNLSSQPHPRYRSFHPRAQLHAKQGLSFTHPSQRAAQSTGPQPSLRQQAPQQGSQLQQQMQPAYTQGQGEQHWYDSNVQGPHQAQGSQQLSIQRVEQQQGRHPSAQQEQNYQQGSHVQTMEQQVNKQPMQHKSPQQQQQMTGMPHRSMVDTMTEQFPQEETLREEERGQGFFREEVTTMNNPVTCVSDKEQLNLQGQSAQGVTVRRGDQTDHHITSHDTTRSPTASDVTSPTVTNRTSSIGSSSGATTPTGLNTNATKTSSGQQSNVGSNTQSTPQLQLNSSTIHTNSNGVTNINQSTGNTTPPSDTAVPTGPAPFKWKKGKMLGRGAFGEVFECMDEDNDRLLAVKEVWIDPNFSNDTRQAVESLEKEIQLLQNLKHDQIVQYYGTERTDTSVRIFMEFMPRGSLYHHIDRYGALKEHTASKYTKQLLEGVEYLHNKKIVHRDIKGANILMDLYGHVKIADFGASKLLRSIYLSSRSHKNRNNTHKSVAGTAYWMAPEVIKGETVNYKADIWSLGCTVVEMFTCRPPYHHLEPFPAMYKIAIEPMSVDLPPECSEHAHDFLYQCFTSSVTERPGASVLLEHQFVQTVVGTSSSTVQQTTATTPSSSSSSSSQVTSSTVTVTHTTDTQVTTDGGSRVAGPTVASNQLSSSDSNDDNTVDDDTSDDHVAADEDIESLKQSFAKMKPPSVQAEQQQQQQQPTSSRDVHSDNKTEPQAEAITTPSPTTVPTTATTSTTTERNGTERIAPDNLQLKQTPQSPTTNCSNTNGSASASNVHDNSTPLKSLPERTISNTSVKDLTLWKNRQQHVKTASHAFVNNLFGNFPGSSETPLVVQMFVMQDSNITFSPTGPTSLPIIDHREIAHNSLEPFAYDISHSVDVPTILPLLIQHGLITRHENDYFMHHSYTNAEKQSKLTCLVVSLNEDCVDKFLGCLSQTSDFAPHDTLLKKIQSGMSPVAHCYTHR